MVAETGTRSIEPKRKEGERDTGHADSINPDVIGRSRRDSHGLSAAESTKEDVRKQLYQSEGPQGPSKRKSTQRVGASSRIQSMMMLDLAIK